MEAKDEKDDLDAEIELKKRRGYPQDNIIFEDSSRAVLVREKAKVYRCPVDDVKRLEKLLDLFCDYERTEIAEFRKAVEQFKTDLPMVLEALRSMIERAHEREPDFRKADENKREARGYARLFGPDAGSNLAFAFAAEERSEFDVFAFSDIPTKDIFIPSAAQVLALFRYENGRRVENITDWGKPIGLLSSPDRLQQSGYW